MSYLLIRMTTSFLAGALLSQAGSLIQLGSRNLLASPSTLGLDGLSVLWVLIFHSLVLYLGVHFETEWTFIIGLPFFLLLGILFPKLISGNTKFERIILLGLTFNLLVGAIFSLWQFLFLAFNLPFPVELWFGHFRFANLSSLILLIIFEALVMIGLKFFFKDLMMFSIGPVMSLNWNLNEKKVYRFIFIVSAMATFIVVSLFGAFSFLALVFPILARKIWFNRWDLKGEMIFGSLLNGVALMLIDSLCYHFPIYGAEVPVGLIVTGVGALSLSILLWVTFKDSEKVANQQK